jgi:SAM-dependent methyltransferase
MGLAKPALRLIAREHARQPFTGPVMILGRQNVFATADEAKNLLRAEGLTPVDQGLPLDTNIPSLEGSGFISDVGYFRLLGVAHRVHALDYSAFENADVVHDFNTPVPEHFHGQFDLVLDSGTTEHIFDVRQSLTNIALLLRPGGRVIHISPSNNFVNHGFYQFSPTLFFDYYAANGFKVLSSVIFDYDPYLATPRHVWHLFAARPDMGWMTSRKNLMVMFIAEKTASSTCDKVPQQSFYLSLYRQSEPLADPGVFARLKRVTPFWAKSLIKKHVPRASTSRKPWGLKSLGRIR